MWNNEKLWHAISVVCSLAGLYCMLKLSNIGLGVICLIGVFIALYRQGASMSTSEREQQHTSDQAPTPPPKAPTPPQNQPRASTPGAAQNTPTIAREPILVLAPYIVDYIITQFIDSDFCFFV